MKAGLLCFAAVSAVAVAQPHGHHRHAHQHAPRAVVTQVDVVTDVEVATATAQNAVVYVDSNGKPISTSYANAAAATPASAAAEANWVAHSSWEKPSTWTAPSPSATSESSSEAPLPTTAPVISSVATSVVAPPPSSSPSASSAAPAPSSSGYGIGYSPYHTDSTCKTQDEVNADFVKLDQFGMVRIYGTDCNQTALVLSAIQGTGMTLFAGVFDIFQVQSEIELIIEAANGDWSKFETVAIGNEGVNDGTYTVAQVSTAVEQARSQLSAAGYSGKVITVDTFVAIIANTGLCAVGDYVGANCHAFFDGGVTADQAGGFVLAQAQRVAEACNNGKSVVITESGWPSQGETNGQAVCGQAEQTAAISSLKSSFSSNLFLFSAYNDYWKTNTASTFDAEQYWGIMGNSASCTPP